MADKRDYYEVLGIDKGASEGEVKKESIYFLTEKGKIRHASGLASSPYLA